jgi:5-methylcytosine-specific restriction endonuclease McrA
MKTYNCGHCGIECKWRHQGNNKFCSVQCAQTFRSLEHKKKFFSGLLEKRIDRPTARKYLAEVRGYKCEVCGISDYQNKPITLHVDHINGDPSNDRPENLRLICPNCHSQTEFLGGANKGRGRGSLGIARY